MLSLFLAAALLSHPTPKVEVALDRSVPQPEAITQTRDTAILSSVAVTLECTAHKTGQVSGCQVLGETHPGLGFGEAAIALMQDAQVEPGAEDVQFARTIQFTP